MLERGRTRSRPTQNRRRSTGLLVVTFALVAAICPAAFAAGLAFTGPEQLADMPEYRAPTPGPRVFSLLDYFEDGRRAVDSYVQDEARKKFDPSLTAIIEKAKSLSVRVELRSNQGEDGYQSIEGSGIVIGGGRWVLTAGHAVDGETDYEIVVTLANGESRNASLIDHRYEVFGGSSQDWALLEITGEPWELPDIPFGRIERGDLTIILGYPDQIGVNEEGLVSHGNSSVGGYLEPLVTLGTVESDGDLRMTPHVGSIPTGGMSGGPVLNSHGQLIGIFVSISRSAGGHIARYRYNAAPLTSLVDRLAARR